MTRVRVKWRFAYLALLAALPFATAPAAEPFQAGRDYIELAVAQPVETGDKIEVREFFWYGCPHCFAIEPALTAYVGKLPAKVKFTRTPGTFSGWAADAQVYYTFEALGVLDKLHAPFLEACQPGCQAFRSEDSVADFAAKYGVDKEKFKEAYKSFSVRMHLERAKQMNVGFAVEGVPALAVDGRYLTSPSMPGRVERTESERNAMALKVVDFLIQKAARDRQKTGR